MLTLIASIIIFGLLIGIHEAGHLIAAKLCGIKVYEFSIGMGFKIFSFTKGDTVYSLRVFPIGGYCKMEGEDEISDSPNAFCNKSPIKKIFVLVSGAIMNLLLGFVVLCILSAASPKVDSTVVDKVMSNVPSYNQGLMQGDRVVKLNNTRININSDIYYAMQNNNGENISLTVKRNSETVELNITPYKDSDRYIIGYTPKIFDNKFSLVVKNSFYNEIFISKVILFSLGDLITGNISVKETSGPVGIVKEIGNAAKNGILNLLYILGLITINLGLFNLLPLPALDGGRVVFSLIELIFRRKVPDRIEAIIHSAGFSLLILLMLYVTFNDIFR